MRRENNGTYRLFQLPDVLITAKDKVIVIDEISRFIPPSFFPAFLTLKFVETFLNRAEQRPVQLIVTTHETRLMTHEFLRCDKVWVCDSADNDSSKLYNFDEKQVRIGKVMDQNYYGRGFRRCSTAKWRGI